MEGEAKLNRPSILESLLLEKNQNMISMRIVVQRTLNREHMAGGIAKSLIHPSITPEPHAGGKCTKHIGTDVTPEDTAIPVWAVCSHQADYM